MLVFKLTVPRSGIDQSLCCGEYSVVMMAAIQEILDYYCNMQPSQEMGSDKLSKYVDIYLYKELVSLKLQSTHRIRESR